MTPAQCRAARALIDWRQQTLADAAGVGNATIRNFEAGRSEPNRATLEALRRALEAEGVLFIEENGFGPGVRLRHLVHPEEGTSRLLFRKHTSPMPPGNWLKAKPLFQLPKLARYNSEGWFVLEEPTEEHRERAMRWYPSPEPTGPATDVVKEMDAAIDKDRKKER